mmetsp:Transcript_28510/g.62753  ORF Transcript_28510/g.62753 Transcript_28510/m.62753 type:complete len:130 (-) Transcript_28510:873-1262(-)|eukprot:CAMPEP_0202889524 /NCGR_PEP_ID=MMETSP1392-20130828/112_1 /ASSEMBLY_ACC=CAM_ASM_000868 /TAXON_ID=225041 /ORGANISM="Chlamydomonas chlamydogama, Strain SAG 11-48b" /LENGTH=129 /DNA_ID=CAMNT_0049572873 /DNA_START=119 /DNA_END=508 /DNA_ORIENTATION=-
MNLSRTSRGVSFRPTRTPFSAKFGLRPHPIQTRLAANKGRKDWFKAPWTDWKQQDEQTQRLEGAQFPVNLFLGLYVIVIITNLLELNMLFVEPVAKELAQLRADVEQQTLKLDRDPQKDGKLSGHSERL